MTVGTKVLVALATLTGISLGAVAISRVAFAKVRPTVPPRPSTPSRPDRDYVGSGWGGWPHKDVFPDADAIVQALRRLGYAVDDSLITDRSMAEVGRFQQDYNTWSASWYAMPDDAPWPEDPASPGRPIDEDELVDRKTVSALYDALLADGIFPGGWQALVDFYADRI